ncbi:MAG: 5'-methylthioadenosine nucleosidase [Proteobacteria bacterium]|nr:5'-methylthioadenosine nucleosidase [Pseudomonadota bacterium]
MKYIIVAALADEVENLDKYAPVILTGIGKINTCLKLYDAIVLYQPELVINYGTAGCLNSLVGLHKVKHFIQADMDARGLGIPRGITPFSEEILPTKTGVVLATSDSFINNADKQLKGLDIAVDIVDMEAYAAKKVCDHHGILFHSYKFISDAANAEAGKDWQNSIQDGTQLFAALLASTYGVSTI